MKKIIEVLRRKNAAEKAQWQSFIYETVDNSATVATALMELNKTLNQEDIIQWEHSCLQKKCGACAMIINGKPSLACDARLNSYQDTIRLEPLRKFPVVADLIVDRDSMLTALKKLQVWLTEEAVSEETEDVYEASRCLQCGCCLEVCPNFESGGDFSGMAAMIPMSRIFIQTSNKAERKEAGKRYKRDIYEGCGKSLACHHICPAGIDIERLLVRSNAAALWRWRKILSFAP